jgi:hypothetical protein
MDETLPHDDPRPWFERKRFVVPLAVAAIAGGLFLAGTADADDGAHGTMSGAASHPSVTDHPAIGDVELVRCRPDAADHWAPHVRITNHSTRPSSYVVTFAVERDHHPLGTATVVVDHLEPGATTEQVGTSQVAGHDLWCRATSVLRLPTG